MLLTLGLLMPAVAWAQFGGGSGNSAESPYIISSIEHMNQLAINVVNGTDYMNCYFRLDADLDYSGQTYTPIGTKRSVNDAVQSRPFRGRFDGNGHTISNVSVNKTGDGVASCFAGLFGFVGSLGKVSNLTLGAGSTIKGRLQVGGIVGYATLATIENCHVAAGCTIGTNQIFEESGDVGGIIGYAEQCTISGCTNAATVEDNNTNNLGSIGGIVGYATGTTVSDCVNVGAVSGCTYVGGIAGQSYNSTFSGCYVGGACNIGAMGVSGSSSGTNEGFDVHPLCSVGFGAGVSGVIHTEPLATAGATAYFACGATVGLTLSVSGTMPTGYVASFATNEGTLSPDGNAYTLALPDTEADITISRGADKRDIGYSAWVSIVAAPQDYTGSALTPTVTVTDNQSGSPVVLTEGIDYQVVLPDGGLIGQNDGGTATHNYYIGACRYKGINFVDVVNQAKRGWPVIVTDERITFGPDYSEGNPIPGIYYTDEDAGTHYYYAGSDENVRFTLSTAGLVVNRYTANGYTLNPAGTNAYGETYYSITMIAGTLTISPDGIYLELLDDDSEADWSNAMRLSFNDDYTGDVRLQDRTLYRDGTWNTLCLPFGVASISGTPLEGAEVRTLETATLTDGTLTLSFGEPLTALEAGKPYLVRWTTTDTDITSPTFGNVSISGSAGSAGAGDATFKANYGVTNLTANTTAKLYLDGDGQLHYAYGEAYPLLAFRGHFQVALEGRQQVGHYASNITANGDMLPAIQCADGNWNEAANWNTGSVPTAGNDVLVLAQATIPSGYEANAGRVIVTGYNNGASNRITIADGGQLYHANEGVYAYVQKHITPYSTAAGMNDGWHLIASPCIGSIIPTSGNGFLTNEYDLYYYDEPTHYWRNHKENGAYSGFQIEPLKGYLYANSEAVTLDLQGTLNAANATVCIDNLDYTEEAGNLKGFNLVGNPFAHNVTTFTGTNVADEVYRMNEAKDNLIVGEISETHPLKPGEGFFVKATAENASITFNGQTRGAVDALEPAERPAIVLNLSQNGLLIDRLILKRDGEPLEKLTLNENNTRIYATQDGQDYAVIPVVSTDVAPNVSTNEIPVNFKAAKNGTYTVSVNAKNMELDYLHLIDNLTGADIDLLHPNAVIAGEDPQSPTPSYTFTAKTTDYASRFRLVFAADGSAAPDQSFAYYADGEIVIVGDTFNASLQVVDMTGRVIVCTDGACTVSTNGMAKGVYVLRLVNGTEVRTQKIVID